MSHNGVIRFPFLDLKKADEPLVAELEEAARRVIRSGRYIGGDEVERLEAQMCAVVETSHAVGVGNGLDALRLSLRALILTGRLKPGDEVIVPANTYIASVLAITDAGLTPRLVDPDESTMCLSGRGVAANLDGKVRAVMPVHLYGRVAWDEVMAEIVRSENLIVVEDVAQAIGARSVMPGLNGTCQAGSLGHVSAFSFYPTKNVGALGDAGMVLTSDSELADAVRTLANYGSDTRYHNIYKGFNSRLDPIQAAMLTVKLGSLNDINARRNRIAATYLSNIDNPAVTLPMAGSTPGECVWHQFVVRTSDRTRFREFLNSRGVGTDVHYAVPPHLQPCYAGLRHCPLPVTERLAAEVVSLPVTPGSTTCADAAEISSIINEYKSN